MKTIIDQMLMNYNIVSLEDKKNALKEVMQEIVLCGLSRAGFFKEAVFYGGTALRIFHKLDRFSEDLDFSLVIQNQEFSLEKYFNILQREVNSMGMNFKIESKEKNMDSNILSAFLKGNTNEHILYFFPMENFTSGINKSELIKIKLEIDITPPKYASFETKYKLLPIPYEVKLYDLSSLFAGKIHAILCRKWSNRVKGRDFYDYIFFLQNNVKVNIEHLRQRLIQSNHLKESQEFNLLILKELLFKRFNEIDYKQLKQDVIPFIKDPTILDIYSSDFFIAITNDLNII